MLMFCCGCLDMGNENETDTSTASLNEAMETVLVDQLVDYSTPKHRGQNGWTKEAWRVIIEGFNAYFPGLRLSTV